MVMPPLKPVSSVNSALALSERLIFGLHAPPMVPQQSPMWTSGDRHARQMRCVVVQIGSTPDAALPSPAQKPSSLKPSAVFNVPSCLRHSPDSHATQHREAVLNVPLGNFSSASASGYSEKLPRPASMPIISIATGTLRM